MMEPINPNEPFVVRQAIMKLAVIMEMKLRLRASNHPSGESHILNKCPGEFNSTNYISKMETNLAAIKSMRRSLGFSSNNEVFYNTEMVDKFIDVCTYGLFIANAFWNRQDKHMNAHIRNGGEVENGPEIITHEEAVRRASSSAEPGDSPVVTEGMQVPDDAFAEFIGDPGPVSEPTEPQGEPQPVQPVEDATW